MKLGRRKKRSTRRAAARARVRVPKSAVTLIVVMQAKEGKEAEVRAELRALVAPTPREEGCLRYELHYSEHGTGAFMLDEVWASRDHHTRHTRTAHFLRWDARKDALLAARELSFWKRIV